MKRLVYVCLLSALLCQGCGKSEEHLRCEKAFKEYYGGHWAAAFAAAAFGAADASALDAASLEVSDYEVLGDVRVADSLGILRQKAEEKYRKSLEMKTKWMNVCKEKFETSVKNYFERRKKAEAYMAAYKASGRQGGYDHLLYECILERPERTEDDLKWTYLKDPYSDYSRYVAAKQEIDDMVARKEEVLDGWFAESARYKSMDADKVLGKYVEVTYRVNGDRNDEQTMVLVFNEDLTRVLGEMK